MHDDSLLRDRVEVVVVDQEPAAPRIADEGVTGVICRDAMTVQRAFRDPEQAKLAGRRHTENSRVTADLAWCVEVPPRRTEVDYVHTVDLPQVADHVTVGSVEHGDPTLGATGEHEAASFVDRDAARVAAAVAPRRADRAAVDIDRDRAAVP